MTRRFTTLAWSAAACTYLLIVLGAVVRITGSGMGCGDHWPLCNGHLFPPLDDIGTVIEWSHRLVAALVSILVVAPAAYDWWLHRASARPPIRPSYVALALLIFQILLGAITVKSGARVERRCISAQRCVLHIARGRPHPVLTTSFGRGNRLSSRSRSSWNSARSRRTSARLRRVTHGATAAVWITAGPLAWIQWIHRLLAYSLAAATLVWMVGPLGADADRESSSA
jgi:heme A synthase